MPSIFRHPHAQGNFISFMSLQIDVKGQPYVETLLWYIIGTFIRCLIYIFTKCCHLVFASLYSCKFLYSCLSIVQQGTHGSSLWDNPLSWLFPVVSVHPPLRGKKSLSLPFITEAWSPQKCTLDLVTSMTILASASAFTSFLSRLAGNLKPITFMPFQSVPCCHLLATFGTHIQTIHPYQFCHIYGFQTSLIG